MILASLSGASAHEGHAHGDAPPPPNIQTAPRATAASPLFELVAVAADNALTITLDRFDTNEPVSGATIEVETPEGPAVASIDAESYRLDAPWISRPGDHELLFTVTAGADIDFLPATLRIPAAATPPAEEPGARGFLSAASVQEISKAVFAGIGDRLRRNDPAMLAMGGIGFVAGMLVMALMRRRRLAAGVTAAILLVALSSTFAHAETAAPTGGTVVRDVAQRLADGRVFAPKAAQRILAIRTMVASEQEHRRSLELPGRVIADPNASGFVQTAVGGRLSAPPGGFPPLGAKVEAGQVLAFIEPSLAAIDQSSIRQTQAELDQEIAISDRQVERFRKLRASGAVSATQLDEAEITLAGLRERRAALDEMKLVAEELVAPISGVVALANASPGLIAESNTVVFHIIDPARLWIEALSYGGEAIGQTASIADAEGGLIPLRLVGTGFSENSQAQPLHFAIEDNGERIRLGQMVTVVAETSASATGLAVPRDAVIRGANGGDIVYVHTDPEVFESRSVRTEPLDGARVLIVAGVAPGDRVVTQGPELLNQLR
ncbi:efflux RND transporter periplasmic adaptor subunit [Paracoccus niistensis]|uniref:Efflux RND transporter periplasmic adaptor subunit n=1 Tax=Paracoccus niistensis TaxID=632935 RepID=A0ABV6HZX1_9RHOB